MNDPSGAILFDATGGMACLRALRRAGCIEGWHPMNARQADAEIEITSEMVSAGMEALAELDVALTERVLVCRIFRAMIQAQRTASRPATDPVGYHVVEDKYEG
jgi:hypothetical protein